MTDATRQRDPRGGSNFIDRTGLRYGSLTVLRRADDMFAPDKSKKKGIHLIVQWLCICDCGRTKVAKGTDLKSGHTTTCGRHAPSGLGARAGGPRPGWLPHTALPYGVGARNAVLQQYQRAARVRDRAWELTDEQFDDITSQDCHYCGQPPGTVQRGKNPALGDFTYNGIDRMNNNVGYVAGNVVPCCRVCNFAKKDLPYAEFVAWLARIAQFRGGLPHLPSAPRKRRGLLTGREPALF